MQLGQSQACIVRVVQLQPRLEREGLAEVGHEAREAPATLGRVGEEVLGEDLRREEAEGRCGGGVAGQNKK